ncbi:MOSC domain-containing protein [Rutstroemia sp. NJR-2017a WRK4]|nr:MOSC domain-containing protein [Rutstroemia sp. NJR-2017a WRK4]
MSSLIQPYLELAQEHFEIYKGQLLEKLATVSTTTYVLTILAICIPPIIALILYEIEEARLRAEQPKGCRKLGLKIDSNLKNEFDKKFSEGRPPSTEETSAEWWRLKSMWIYPVKSCKGVELNRGTVVAAGMEYDLAENDPNDKKSAHKWQFITQRQFPLLAKVRTEMWVPDQSVDTYAAHVEDVESGGVIILSFPYQEAGWKGKVAQWGAALKGKVPEKQFRIPFDPTPVQIEKAGYTYEKMTIWKETVTALNLEIEIPEEEVHRNAPTKEQLGYQPVTGFQDAYPLHLINLASVRDIERQIPTARCKMPNVDQVTGERHPSEPDRTIRSFRAVDEGAGRNTGCLGMQLVPCAKESALRVGDEITVLETGSHCYIPQ